MHYGMMQNNKHFDMIFYCVNFWSPWKQRAVKQVDIVNVICEHEENKFFIEQKHVKRNNATYDVFQYLFLILLEY